MDQALTLRERRRRQRHRRIEQAALELFSERGFDHVTVEDVCARAGVGPATFYRHFGTKEDVVFAYQEGFAAALTTAVLASAVVPERRDRLECVLSGFARYLESQEQQLALRDRIVLGHPGLLRGTHAVLRGWEEQLALELAQLRGMDVADDAAALDAAVGLGVVRLAVRRWRAGRSSSLSEAMASILRELDGLVTPQTWGAVRRSSRSV